MAYLSAEEQRRRTVEVASHWGVDCPEMVLESAKAVVGGGLLRYRCRQGGPVENLRLTPEQARYVGIDMSG